VLFSFENCILDTDRRELRREGAPAAVEPQVFDLLEYLIRNRERVVSKDDLLATIWGKRSVSESALSTRINAARYALGDSGEQQRLIRTVLRKGFRFVGAVRELREPMSPEPDFSPANRPSVHALPGMETSPNPKFSSLGRPSIAVLPFANLSGDPAQEYFADGMTEEIITGLSRLRWLFVIARNSSFAYKGKAVDVRQVAQDLSIRYLLAGSIRVARGRVRITGQLVDAETGNHIWAERYDRQLDDFFAVQDEIAENVIAAIEPYLYVQEGYRAQNNTPSNLDAWGHVAQALPLIMKLKRIENGIAQTLLQRAIDIDPQYARPHAILSWARHWESFCWWAEDVTKTYESARRAAEDAVSLDAHDPWALAAYGIALSTIGQHERALNQFRSALEHNPSFALAHTMYGLASVRAGQFEQAVEETAKALRMSPIDDFSGVYSAFYGLALLCSRRLEEALASLRKSVSVHREMPNHYNALISCCGHLGRLSEARAAIEHRNKIGPPLRAGTVLHNQRLHAHAAFFSEGLRKAGVPD
jgi:adenylate cyclase